MLYRSVHLLFLVFVLPFACQSSVRSIGDNSTPNGNGKQMAADGGAIILPDTALPVDKPPREVAEVAVVGCGNGVIDPGLDEVCDDGNGLSGDGCAAGCKTLEKDHVCTRPGIPCTYLVTCGDGRLGGKETCDDGNTTPSDGCNGQCMLESGWDCQQPGAPCSPHCGDGQLFGSETCDPPNAGKGCSSICMVEPGYFCDPPLSPPDSSKPSICHKTQCGDGKKEGTETCDDKNSIDGDGCAANCSFEPDCKSGQCTSKCGDGMNLPPEECDDSNVQDGDGCSHECKIENGFTCTDAALEPASQLNLLATYRDVISFPTSGNQRHPDFEIFGESTAPTLELVKPMLGATGKPVMEGRCAKAGVSLECPFGQQFTTSANFDQWYQDTPGVNIAVPGTLRLPRLADGSYVFDSNTQGFYPVDGKGFVASKAKEMTTLADAVVNDGGLHNFGFTTEIRYFFQFRGGEILTFSGDDDVWIFINRRLALDLGGLHPRLEETLFVDQAAATLGLVKNGLYEIVLFHAERHSTASNFMLTLTGFSPASSHCKPTCGDAVVIPPEACDLGKGRNTGDYNVCTPECRLGPRCGDGILQAPEETCDDGINLTTYAASSKPACAPGCVPSGYCGDGIVDGQFGEQCDLGTAKNSGEYGGCTATCALGPRCGDGVIDEDHHEQCDDGNTVSGDLCTNNCQLQVIL